MRAQRSTKKRHKKQAGPVRFQDWQKFVYCPNTGRINFDVYFDLETLAWAFGRGWRPYAATSKERAEETLRDSAAEQGFWLKVERAQQAAFAAELLYHGLRSYEPLMWFTAYRYSDDPQPKDIERRKRSGRQTVRNAQTALLHTKAVLNARTSGMRKW